MLRHVVAFFACALITSTAVAGDEEEDEFLVIERPTVTAPAESGPYKIVVAYNKKEAVGGAVTVKTSNGFDASWDGKPGVIATFGNHAEGTATITVTNSVGTVTEEFKLKGADKQNGSTCRYKVKSSKTGPQLSGTCTKNPPPIQLDESVCHAPMVDNILVMIGTRVGCMAYRFQVASDLALDAQADMAIALGLKAQADQARQKLDNLAGVEDPLERQAIAADAVRDPALAEQIVLAMANSDAITADSLAAIQQADQRRIAARKASAMIAPEIAELTLYFTTVVLKVLQNPKTAITYLAQGLNIPYINNYITPLSRTLTRSQQAYKDIDTRLEQALATLYKAKSIAPPDPSKVDVKTFQSDKM